MSRAGVGIGIGEGLEEIAKTIRERRLIKEAHRDREADRLEKQLQQIAQNKVQLKQELALTPQGTPDYVSKATELQNIDDILAKSTQDYHALGAEDPGWLVGRLKGLFGRHEPVTTPPFVGGTRYKQGITQTPELLSAAAPLPDIKEGDPYQQHQAELRRTNQIADLKALAPVQQEAAVNQAKAMSDLAEQVSNKHKEVTLKWAQEHLSPELVNDLMALQSDIPASLLAKEKVAPKPLVPHISDKMLVGIDDPNNGANYHAGNIDKAPPEVKAQWDAITKQQDEERVRDEAAQTAKNVEAEKRDASRFAQQLKVQEQALQNALDSRDYTDAKKQISVADTDYQGAIDRQKTMEKNIKDALKGDQQAMVSLLNNHIAMTTGKNQRVTQALLQEAMQSAPWLENVEKAWSKDGYLQGIKLSPEQMNSMVNLAKEKVEILKDHKTRLDTQYSDVLKLNKATPGELKNSAAPKTSIDDEIMNAIKPKAAPKKK